jgi:hypothetical protein
MINSSRFCFENCKLAKIGDELPPPLVIDKKCSECEYYVCENHHNKCINCFNDNDFNEYFYYHSDCLTPPKLEPSRYFHEGECYPDKDRCENGCWRYWCSDCNFGVSGMYSPCTNIDCKRHYQIFTSKGIKCLLCNKEDINYDCNCFKNKE